MEENKNNTVQKPVSMVITTTTDSITELLNTSGLPVSVLKLIVGNIYNEICYKNEMITAQEIAAYNKNIEANKSETTQSE